MNKPPQSEQANRILIIDDNAAIHDDIKMILCPNAAETADLSAAEAALFGAEKPDQPQTAFEIDSAYQGQDGLKLVEKALAEGRPYSVAFVDERMPPGWSGIETIRAIWSKYPDLQCVICTAYSDHSWQEIIQQTGKTDSLLILKKPFDNVEILQLAHALTKKWALTRQARIRVGNLEANVKRGTADLVQVNEQLRGEIERRARVESSLRESKERFRKFFEATSAALAILRTDNLKHIEVNDSYIALTGHSRAALMGRSPLDLKLPANPGQFEEVIKALRAGYQILNVELEVQGGDNRLHHTIMTIVPVTLDEGACYLTTLTDVTDRHKVESQFRQAQKMEAVGQLAAGIAHDFNNILTIIQGYSSLQLANTSLNKEVAHAFQQVKTASDRAASLTRQLLNFSHKQPVRRKPVDLAASLTRLQSMLPRLLSENIRLRCSYPKKLPQVNADESCIEQVIINLVVNARDAMPTGGEVLIETSTVELARDPQQGGRPVLMISVKDTGCGMDEKTRDRIFDPFFTTKPVGKGTGLGLSMVYSIVQQHEGWIDVQSTRNVGTTFQIFLPVYTEESAAQDAASDTPVIKPGKGKILVAEDEPSVRQYICEVLQQNEYTVCSAADGEAAILNWEQAGGMFNVLLTDMVMPGSYSGKLLAQRLLKQKSDLRVVYMTGYSAELSNNDLVLTEGLNFLPKPFTRDQLLLTIQSALQNTDPASPAAKTAST